MKLTRINEKTIRCVFSGEEVRLCGLTPAQIAGSASEAGRVLQEVVEQEARRVNFVLNDSYNCIRVELMKDGGVSLTMAENTLPITKEEIERLSAKEGGWFMELLQELLESAPADSAGAAGGTSTVDSLIERLGRMMDQEQKKNAESETEDEAEAAAASPEADEEEDAQESRSLPAEREYGYIFATMDEAIACARTLDPAVVENSSLYNDGVDYYLFLSGRENADVRFEKMVLFMTEFGSLLEETKEGIASIKEHSRLIAKDNAIALLKDLA